MHDGSDRFKMAPQGSRFLILFSSPNINLPSIHVLSPPHSFLTIPPSFLPLSLFSASFHPFPPNAFNLWSPCLSPPSFLFLLPSPFDSFCLLPYLPPLPPSFTLVFTFAPFFLPYSCPPFTSVLLSFPWG